MCRIPMACFAVGIQNGSGSEGIEGEISARTWNPEPGKENNS